MISCFLKNPEGKQVAYWVGKKREEKFLLALDIGTEAVKAIIFQKSDDKIYVLANSLQYFEKYGVFSGRYSEKNIIKNTIEKTIDGLRENLSFSFISADLKNKIKEQKRWEVLVGISPDKFKGRIVFQEFLRQKPSQKISKEEENIVCQEVIKKAQEEISKKFAPKLGILPGDIYLNSTKILEVKIDGYNVPALCGYEGKNLRFRILVTFLSKYYLEDIQEIFKEQPFGESAFGWTRSFGATKSASRPVGFKIIKVVHPAEVLYYKEENGIFIDIGGSITQFFLIEDGSPQEINEFDVGGKFFSEKLSQNFGIDEDTAKALKEEYSDKLLSIEAFQKIKKIFHDGQKNWYLNLKEKIGRMEPERLFSSDIYIFGGGSLLPDIKDVLEEGTILSSKEPAIPDTPKIKIIYPKDLKNIENLSVGLKSPQNIPTLLICQYAQYENFD